MSWKRLKKRRRGREKGAKFKDKTLFFTAKHKDLAAIVDFTSVKGAETGSAKLVTAFNNAKTRNRKRIIKQATVSAANRAAAAVKNPKLSSARVQELTKISNRYRSAYLKMELPPKTTRLPPNKPKRAMSKLDVGTVEAEAYEVARIRMEKVLASRKSRAEVEKKIDGAITELQLMSIYSTKGGFGGAPDYDKIQAGIRALNRLKADVKAGKIGKRPKITMKEVKPIGVSTTGRYELREKGKTTLYFDRKDDALVARGKLPLGRWKNSWVEDALTGACVGGTKYGSEPKTVPPELRAKKKERPKAKEPRFIKFDGFPLKVLKEKHGIRLLQENVAPPHKKPKYDYAIQYQNEDGTWKRPEFKVSFSRAKDEFDSQSKFPFSPLGQPKKPKSRSEIAKAAAKKAWATRKEKKKAKPRTYGKPIPKSKPSRNVPLTISHLSGMQLKKDIDFTRAIKRYHNKHKDGSGNFGFTLVDKNGKWFNLSGDYDSNGRIHNLGFGTIAAAPTDLTPAGATKVGDFYTYNSIVNEIKRRHAPAVVPPKKTPVGPKTTQLNGHDQYIHQWEVPSKTRADKTYKVSEHAEGHFLCSCPAFIFQKGPISHRKPCKHIKEVKAKAPARAPSKVTPAVTSKKGVYAPPKRWWSYMTEEPHGPKRTPLSPAAAGHLWFKVYDDKKRAQIIENPSAWIAGRTQRRPSTPKKVGKGSIELRKVHKMRKGAKTGSMAELHDSLVKQGFSYQLKAGKPSFETGEALYRNPQGVQVMLKRVKKGKTAVWLAPKRERGLTVQRRTAPTADVWMLTPM